MAPNAGQEPDLAAAQAASILWTSLTRSRRCTGLDRTLACLGAVESPFSATAAQARPVPFGSPDGAYSSCGSGAPSGTLAHDDVSTTHLSVIDQWGNAVAYTSTIEATGGSGITVPGWGFILNNELTDFSFVPVSAGVPDPNLPGPSKRPRSSMSPTIVLDDGALELVAGSPGGATIITTVAQILLGHYERGLPVGDAVAAPRLSSRNGSSEQAEPAIADGIPALVEEGSRHVPQAPRVAAD